MSCLAANYVATRNHYLLEYEAPYSYLSVPDLLGLVGGTRLLVGPIGLLWLNLRGHRCRATRAKADRLGFILLLLLTSMTGPILLDARARREVRGLTIHLGCVMTVFLSMPYGKFAHSTYRSAALRC